MLDELIGKVAKATTDHFRSFSSIYFNHGCSFQKLGGTVRSLVRLVFFFEERPPTVDNGRQFAAKILVTKNQRTC